MFSYLVFLKAFLEHRCILSYNEESLFLFLLISVNPVYSQCEMEILLKGGRSFYNPPIGHLHDDAISLLRPESFRVLLSCAY